MSKIIKAVFTGRFCTTRRVFQWDTDDKLQFVNLDLPQNYTVDFANSLTGQSVSVLATSDTVQIPPEMMTPDSEIYAWVWVSDTNGGYTKCQATIPSDPRAQHPGLEPTPAQASAWDEAVDALNDAAADYETAISHAPIIQNDYWYIWDSTAGEYVNTNVKADGVDGENGNIIWWTTAKVLADGDNATTVRRRLNGPDGLTPAAGDYVFGPSIGTEGDPTTLYIITASAITVTMTALGSIVGPAGQDGTDGADGQDGQDGYSPVVTITEITGGHRVTITDADHPQGQSFDVMDGQGGSGSSDYDDLTNKPQINSVTLTGNKSLSDLGIEPEAFVVTITNSGGSYSADKTYAQITAAASAGKRVVATIDDVYFSYYGLVSGADALFYNTKQLTSSFWSISSSNVLTHYTSTAGNYSKPVSGIPKTDLASAVQTSLGKADTALQPGDVDEPYFVTYNTSDMTTWTCDKTFAQITAAMAAGTQVVLLVSVGGTPVSQRCDVLLSTDGDAYYIECWTRYARNGWYRIIHNDDDSIEFYDTHIDSQDVDAVASDQGVSHAGEFLVVGSDGNVTTMTLATWQGGNY